jgi:histidine ammonia-lyase
VFVVFAVHAQVKSYEADVVEAQGYKGAIAAADELKGLLEGSKAVGSRKGLSTEQQAAYSSLPQVRAPTGQPVYYAYG